MITRVNYVKINPFQEPEVMVGGLSLRALLEYIKNGDMPGLKGFLANKHVQVNFYSFAQYRSGG